MKKTYNIKFYLLAVVLLITSCNKFLDVTPDNRLRLDSYDKIAELVANAYPAASYIFLEAMSDNVGDAKTPELKQITDSYKWLEVIDESESTPVYYWNESYFAIAHANQALVALDELGVTDIDRHNAIKGEALACRAYAHFMLVNIFAKHYNATTAATDLGIVYLTTPETTLLAEYERITVAQTYKLIEEDLQEALKLVTNVYYKNTGKYHFRREALYAFASRLYLYKGEWENCVKYSSMLLGSGYDPSYVRDFATIYAGSSSESIGSQFTHPTVKANILMMKFYSGYSYMTWIGGYRFTANIKAEIELGDYVDSRLVAFTNSSRLIMAIPKFHRNLWYKPDLTSSSGYPYIIKAILRSEETVLNRIEAYLMSGQVTLAESDMTKYLSAVYTNNRFRSYAAMSDHYIKVLGSTLTGNELMLKIILDERRREFVEEGLRWFDIKRYSLSVTHTDSNGGTDTLTEDDIRKILPIPRAAVDFGGLEQNPIPPPSGENASQKVLTN